MSDALSQAKHRLAIGLDREPLVFEPLIADQWVVRSLLQKSIRRGEVEIAERAALTFLAEKGSAIWRRFIVMAFEDIGASCTNIVAMTVAGSTDAKWRKQSGGDNVVASHLARLTARQKPDVPFLFSTEQWKAFVRDIPDGAGFVNLLISKARVTGCR